MAIFKQISLDPPAKNRGHLQEVLDYDDDEEEETLSLCDLSIHDHSAESDQSDNVGRSSSSSLDDQELFEFSLEDLSVSNYETDKNIIFCGKLIPRRDQPIYKNTQKLGMETNTARNPKKKETKSRSSSFNKTRIARKGELGMATKCRWYSYMFGLARFPMEMELRDIRERQSRRIPAPMMFRWEESGGEKVGGGRSRAKGLWRLVRSLGCKTSNHANTMVNNSLACI